MAAAPRRLDARLDAVRRAATDPRADAAREVFRDALADRYGVVVGRAAKVIGTNGLDGYEEALVDAFDRLTRHPLRDDAGCVGKLAIAEALDRLDWPHGEPFLSGARVVQLEPVFGGKADTAGPLRARCASALARRRWPGVLSLLADHLADPEPPVRAAAARSIPAAGEPSGAALLRLKLHVGDDDGAVLADALAAMCELDPDGGVGFAARWLAGNDVGRRETAALALGETRLPAALAPLLSFAEAAVDEAERRVAYVALAMLRLPDARAWLLERLREASARDAVAIVEALAPWRHEPELGDAVRGAARARGDDAAAAAALEHFGDGGDRSPLRHVPRR